MARLTMATTTISMVVLLLFCSFHVVAAEEKQLMYIVHMTKCRMPTTFVEHGHWYDASLHSISDFAKILYSYDIVAHGFSARLTLIEAQALESLDSILFILSEVHYELHTTQTPEFLGFNKSDSLVPQANTISDVVVGVLDTIFLSHKSFMSNLILHTALTNLLLICRLPKNGQQRIGLLASMLFNVAFQSLCVKKHPITGWASTFFCGAHPTMQPLSLISSSTFSALPSFPPSLPLSC